MNEGMVAKEGIMKIISRMLAMSLLFFIVVLPAFSQDEVIEINNQELGIHTRPLVQFPHMIHEEVIECSECHHEYDDSGANIGGDGGSCTECHTKKAGSNPVPLMEAYHLQCKQCHAKTVAKEKKSIPQMCGQCHVKKK